MYMYMYVTSFVWSILADITKDLSMGFRENSCFSFCTHGISKFNVLTYLYNVHNYMYNVF